MPSPNDHVYFLLFYAYISYVFFQHVAKGLPKEKKDGEGGAPIHAFYLFKQLFNKLKSVVNILSRECTVTHSIIFLGILFLNPKLLK